MEGQGEPDRLWARPAGAPDGGPSTSTGWIDRAWAEQFVDGPAVALAAAKKAIDGGLDVDLRSGLDLEAELFAALFATEDGRNGMASFVENGPGRARFTGR